MRSFLEQYGTAIFTLVLLTILIAFAGPVGTIIKTNVNTQIQNVDEITTEEVQVAKSDLTSKLDGYGDRVSDDIYNYVDWDTKTYHKRVGKVDLGSLDYTFANNNPYRVVFYTYIDSAKIPKSYYIAPNATSTKFTSVSYSKSWTPGDFSIFNNHKTYFTTDGTNSTNPVVFKQSLQGVILYYELETEEVIDISNMID